MLTRLKQDQNEIAELVIKFDKRCFPEEMLLSKEEVINLLKDSAQVYTWKKNRVTQGMMILIPETAVFGELEEVDPEIELDPNGLYSYSIAVPRWHRGKGVATALIKCAVVCALDQDHTSLSGHIRTKNRWHDRRASIIKPQERRLVPNFWEKDGAVEFQRLVF